MIDSMTGMVGITVCSAACCVRKRRARVAMSMSLFDVAVHQLSYMGTWYVNGGENISRLARSAHHRSRRYKPSSTKDGWVYVMCMKQKFWEELAQRIGHPELIDRSRFATPAARRSHRAELTRALDEGMSAKTTANGWRFLTGRSLSRPSTISRRPSPTRSCRPGWSAQYRIQTNQTSRCSPTRSGSTASGRSKRCARR